MLAFPQHKGQQKSALAIRHEPSGDYPDSGLNCFLRGGILGPKDPAGREGKRYRTISYRAVIGRAQL